MSVALCLSDSEMYNNLYKCDDDKFDRLLPDELIADIASCMSDDLPVSLEQFYEINRLIDADAETQCSVSHHILDMIDSEVVGMDDCEASESESCGSDISKPADCIGTVLFTANSANSGTDPCSPDSEVGSLECEELYEESVVNGVPSTISCEELEDLMTSGCDHCDVELEPVEDVEISHQSRRRRPPGMTNCRRLRKKEQNKTAALRYRLKKRSEQGLVLTEYAVLERRNIELRTRLDAMTAEISYLKSLIDELCP